MTTTSELKTVGKAVRRVDGYDKVTGGKGYTVNVALPGMLHGKLLRSPYAHARVTGIDTTEAEKLSGVKAILTYQDKAISQRKYTPVFFVPTQAASAVQDMLVMSDTVRWAGQPVAAVAATTQEIAEQALELIDVDYEELPMVFDPEEAMSEGAPQLHPHAPNNIAKEHVVESGDTEAGFAEADHIIEGTYETQRVHSCYMEPRVCVVDSDTEGNITAHSSMQHLFGLQEKLAFILDIPIGKVKAVKPPYIGGGFGAKLDISLNEPIAALLSLKAGRPVRIEQTRNEDFISTTRNPIKIYMKTGVKNDGTITALYAKSILDTGAHATHGPMVTMVQALLGMLNSYKWGNQKWDGFAVYTNNIIGGGYRGYGAPQGIFAVEQHMDEICEQLQFDPIEFRLKNAYQEGEPHPYAVANLNTYRFEDCLHQGAERIGWAKRSPAGSDNGVKKRGIGLACNPIWCTGCLGQPDIYEHSGATIKLNTDGSVDVATASIDMGCGQNTVLCQFVAEELGIPMNKVRLSDCDTSTVPFDAPTHASRITYCSGGAVKAAAADAKQKLFKVAAQLLEANEGDLTIENEMVFVKGAPDSGISIAEVVLQANVPFVIETEQGPQLANTLSERGSIFGTSSMRPPESPSPASAQFVEVEVDTETGQVDILRVIFANDIGTLVNPSAAEGQVEGGFQQGMGYALMENLQFDPETGACLTGDFLDYKMPTSVEMPRHIESIFIESNEPTGPFGAKSLADPINVPAPAIANAIYNAIGVRFRELPITPEKILAALGKF